MGDSFSTLSDSLKELGFEVGRFKTGTPCRLHGRTIDFTQCEMQHGDDPALPFSYMPEELVREKHDIFSLNHWHAVIVFVLTIVVLGSLALFSIPVDILPVNRTPAVQVLTFYSGMPAAAHRRARSAGPSRVAR